MTTTRRQSCEDIEQLLDTALADQQSADTDPEVHRHLATCTRCRRHAERLEDLRQTLHQEPVPDPGEAYWQQLPVRVQQRLQARPAWRQWPLWGGLAAAAVLALILVRLPQPPATQPGPDAGAPPMVASEAPEVPAAEAPSPEVIGSQGTVALEANSAAGGDDAEDLRCLLNDLLGPEDVFDLTGESWDLTDEEQRLLLESLRAEMENPA